MPPRRPARGKRFRLVLRGDQDFLLEDLLRGRGPAPADDGGCAKYGAREVGMGVLARGVFGGESEDVEEELGRERLGVVHSGGAGVGRARCCGRRSAVEQAPRTSATQGCGDGSWSVRSSPGWARTPTAFCVARPRALRSRCSGESETLKVRKRAPLLSPLSRRPTLRITMVRLKLPALCLLAVQLVSPLVQATQSVLPGFTYASSAAPLPGP